MVSFVSLCILLACGYVTLGEEMTATSTTTNGRPNLLHIISSISTTKSTSTSNTHSTVTIAPHYSTTETVTSDTTHEQTESDSHPSTPVTTDYETSSDYISSVANKTEGSFETSGAESDNVTSQNATNRDTDSFQDGSSLETSTVSSSISPDLDRTRTTSTTNVDSHGPSTTPGYTEDVHTSSANQREGTSTKATSTTSTSATHTTTPTTLKTTSATTTLSSVTDTTASTKLTSTSIPGTSNDDSVQKGEENLSINSNHLYIFGVCIGLAGAVFFITIAAYFHMSLKNSWKKKICLNRDAKRTDWLKVRRFTINDVKASLGGIPANGDIWLEMNKDSSVVL